MVGHLFRSQLARQLVVDFKAADGAASVLDYQVHLGLLSLEQLRVGEAAGDFYLHWTRIHEAVDGDEAKQRDSQQQQLQVVDEGREEYQDGPETSVGDRLAGPHLYVFDRDRWHLYRGQELCQYLLWLDAQLLFNDLLDLGFRTNFLRHIALEFWDACQPKPIDRQAPIRFYLFTKSHHHSSIHR